MVSAQLPFNNLSWVTGDAHDAIKVVITREQTVIFSVRFYLLWHEFWKLDLWC